MNSLTDERVDKEADRALCRSHIYALLAMGFGYPDEASHKGFSDGSFIDDIRDELEVCFPNLLKLFNEEIAAHLALDCTREEFESQFLSAFEINMPSPSASLNEGAHIFKSDRPGLLLELKGFYCNFGLQVDSAGNELEDTLTAEFDFMQFLSLKQAQAQLEGASPNAYKLAQKDFLERHLCAWLPLVRREIVEKVTTPFFVRLSVLADQFALSHLNELKAELGNGEGTYE